MTIDDVRDMGVDRFCTIIMTALEAGRITGEEAIGLIVEFWKELK